MAVPSVGDMTAAIGSNFTFSYHGSDRDFSVVGTLIDVVPIQVMLNYLDGTMQVGYADLIDAVQTTDDVTDPTPL